LAVCLHPFSPIARNGAGPLWLTGHSSKDMNENYTHLQAATLKAAMKALPLFATRPQ
jgi:hypothetical protein